MSDQPYEVTALKYRPQTFAEVVGQEHITRTLQNALATRQIAHAYLFAGPRGTGKTTTARLLAKALNCRSAETMVREPCGECESCRSIARGSSIDVMEIDGASNNSVDQIRELRETVRYAAFEGRYKVYIIDEVHMLSQAAFNALLKTLEEPPEHVVFVFATTEPHKVIPTIISRVQRYDFRRIGLRPMVETLTRIIEAEGLTAEPEALHLIAAKADGALRDAESLLDQVRAFTGDHITLDGARTVLGVVDAERFFRLTRLAASNDAAGALKLAAELVEEGQDPFEFMLGYAEHLRYLIAAAAGGEAGLEALLEGDRKRYLEAADLFGIEDYLRRLETAGEVARSLRSSPQPWIELEAAFLRFVHMDRSVDLRRLLDRIDASLAGSSGPGSDRGSASFSEPAATPAGGAGRVAEAGPDRATGSVHRADPGRDAGAGQTEKSGRRAAPGPATPAGQGTGPDQGAGSERTDGPEGKAGSERTDGPDQGAGSERTDGPGRKAGSERTDGPERDAEPDPMDDGNLPPVDAYEDEIVPEPPTGGSRSRTSSGPSGSGAGDVRGKWKEIVDEVRRRKVALGAFLSEAHLKGVKDNNLLLAFEGENHTFHINQVTRHADLIRDVTRQLCGHPFGVTCVKGEAPEERRGYGRSRTGRGDDLNQQLLERLCSQNEDLRNIVDLFNARLEDGPGGRAGIQG